MSCYLGTGELDSGYFSDGLCCDRLAAIAEVWLLGCDWGNFGLCKYRICQDIKILHPLEHVWEG